MKTQLRLLVFLTAVVLTGTASLPLSAATSGTQNPAASTGVIEGRVFNSATGSALAKAQVTVAGTNLETLTDESGSYRLTGVPAGEARVSVSYIGMAAQTATISVPTGGVEQREFELVRSDGSASTGEVVRLQEFNVVADREMSAQAVAMNEQRHAPNIKNVVAIDEYGDQGDETIMNFLKFLPSVSIQDDALGAGSVSLRGFPANNTGVMVDGDEFSSARTASTRTVVLIEVPMSNISRVEVTKVPTPDMPASGLGGQYSFSKRVALFVSATDIGGGESRALRYAPGTPEYAKPTRVQENGWYTTFGIKGEF